MCLLVQPVMAGPSEDGRAAYDRGDYETAMQLWRPLAERGFAGAQFNIGLAYETGNGVLRDYSEGMKWYRLAAEQAFTNAQYSLGYMYANGQGVPRDIIQVHMWSHLAAIHGIEGAANRRDEIAKLFEMSAQQIAEAQKFAVEWLAAHPKE